MNYICPICGFDKLFEPPFDKFSCGSFEICPCCGTEFGYHLLNSDMQKIISLRKAWINNGMIFKKKERIPAIWKANEQIKNLEKIDIDNNVYNAIK